VVRSFIYLAVASAAVSLGVAAVYKQYTDMDERDQDQAVALYQNLKAHTVIDQSQELKDKISALTFEIKSRWHKTPEELIRHFYRRHRVFIRMSPGPDQPDGRAERFIK